MVRRGLLLGLVIVLAFATGAFAGTAAMKVTVNGAPVSFRVAPRFSKHVLMVPLEDLVTALGLEARWNVNENTLEIISSAPAIPARPLSWDEVAAKLATDFGAYGDGERKLRVTWRVDPYSSEESPLVLAEMHKDDYPTYTALKGPQILAWFKEASALVARAYPKSARVVLVWNGVYHDYPYDRPHDNIALTEDYQWSATDCELWSEIANGAVRTFWDEQLR